MSYPEQLASYHRRVDDVLRDVLSRDCEVPQDLREAMEYSVLGGGKRVRPLLAYSSAEICSVAPEQVDSVAAALELCHAYSLVHDDLPAMDDDDLRRGRPTNHKVYGEATAILVGDALQTLAFETLANDPHGSNNPSGQLAAIHLFARAVGAAGMVGGQHLDLHGEGASDLAEVDIEAVHRRKTGALIHAAVMMPYELSESDASLGQALDTYARALGLLFQICDDILEVTGDTETLGKSANSDANNDKATYVTVLGLEEAMQRSEDLYNQATTAIEALPGDTSRLRWLADFVVRRDR